MLGGKSHYAGGLTMPITIWLQRRSSLQGILKYLVQMGMDIRLPALLAMFLG